jgi:hypothetical protein
MQLILDDEHLRKLRVTESLWNHYDEPEDDSGLELEGDLIRCKSTSQIQGRRFDLPNPSVLWV